MNSKFISALAVLVGTMIGAGFLGIPYVVSQSGFIPGLCFLIFIAAFILLVKLYLGEVSLRTKGNHQLTGYAEHYLGKKGKILMFFAMFFGIYGALLAYLIAEGQSLSYMILGNFDHSFIFSIGFWILMAFLSYIGLTALKKYEKIAMVIVWILMIFIFIFFFKDIKIENLNYTGENIFLPFGVILFSFLAFSTLPEIERILIGHERFMKRTIIIGTLIAFVVYTLFTLIVVGKLGVNVQEIATINLGRFFSLLGVITMFTAFFASSIAIRDMFRFDFKLGRFFGWVLAVFVPIILFLLFNFFKVVSFIDVLGVAGVVSGGLTGILILLMNRKAKLKGNRKPEYSIKINWWIIAILSLIFVTAVILELVL